MGEYQPLITDVKNAAYNEDGSINCDVKPDGVDGYLPYTASQADPTEFGRLLWKQLTNGTWGVPVPFKATEAMIAAAREQKCGEINAWRDAQENAGYTFSFRERNWDYGKAAQARLAPVSALAKSGQLPEGFFWTDADNRDVPVTAEDILALDAAMTGAMVAKGFEIHRHQRELKEALDKLSTLEEIRAFRVE